MTSKDGNVATSTRSGRSKPSTTASCSPIEVDDGESPAESPAEVASDPSVVPITSRHTSSVWSHFKRKRVGETIKAECNYCSKQLAGGPKAGTTHLKDHSKVCPKRVCQDIRQTRLFGTKQTVNDNNESLTLAPYEFHQEDGRRDLAEMIILHEYPISMVEHYGFRKYSNTLQPGFKVPSRTTTRKDIMKRYELERENIATLLRKARSRVALTTDMWSANNQTKGYMVVTSHFIDNAWKLQSRILRFLYVPAPHTAEVLSDSLKQCIQSWNLDLRLSSITVDNCTTNNAMMDILKGSFPYGSLLLEGEFIHMRCCAHILNLIVQEGLSEVVHDGVERIRESVVFWTGSDKRVQKFEKVANQIAPHFKKKLSHDCKTRWNSTYEMLNVAINYREVFVVLSGREKLYKNPPIPEDWEKVEKICEHLAIFSTLTLDFSASKTPTANLYFPKICALKLAITSWLKSPIDYIQKMARVMLVKYNSYWNCVNGLMGVATILDPRYKMALIRFYFEKIFDYTKCDEEVSRISNLLRRLVDEYGTRNGKSQGTKNQQSSDLASGGISKGDCFMQEFAQFLEQDKSQNYDKSDLDKYLEDPNVPLVDEFDILNWWKTNGGTYPVLQQIARDILSIPVSTVPSESAFSTSGRVLSPYRSRLLPEAVEALMCSQNWIWASLKNSGAFKEEDFAKIVGELEEECVTELGSDDICVA